jgi:hypothetical protein
MEVQRPLLSDMVVRPGADAIRDRLRTVGIVRQAESAQRVVCPAFPHHIHLSGRRYVRGVDHS